MNKFTETLNESKDFETIENSITPISDILGRANVTTLNFGEKSGYVFKWKLSFDINQYNGEKEVDLMLKIFEPLMDIQSLMQRVEGYQLEFKIDDFLHVRFTPDMKSSDDYQFVVGQNWRNIIINYMEVTKFFKDRGFSIKNTKIEDNIYNDTSSIYIFTNADELSLQEFKEKLDSEINTMYNEEETINKQIFCQVSDGVVYIYADEEKTYVVFNQTV